MTLGLCLRNVNYTNITLTKENVIFYIYFDQRRQPLFNNKKLHREGMQLLTSTGGATIQVNECVKVQAKRAQSGAKTLASRKTCKNQSQETLNVMRLYCHTHDVWGARSLIAKTNMVEMDSKMTGDYLCSTANEQAS